MLLIPIYCRSLTSFGGHSPPPDAVDEFINDANAFVVQAAANVGWTEFMELVHR